MGFFYERTETKDKVIIQARYLPLYYAILIISLLSIIVLSGLYGLCGSLLAGVPVIFLLIACLDMRKDSSTFRKFAKKKGVKVSGNKWSLSNQPRIEIPKELMKEAT